MPTLIIPCPNVIDCPGSDNPIRNLSAEEPDVPLVTVAVYSNRPMPLGSNWGQFGGFHYGTGIDGDTARRRAQESEIVDYQLIPPATGPTRIGEGTGSTIPTDTPAPPPFRDDPDPGYTPDVPGSPGNPESPPNPPFTETPPPPWIFTNNPQTCSLDCGGTVISFVFPAGFIVSLDQTSSDALAMAWACWLLATYCGQIVDPPTVPPIPGLVGNTPQTVSFTCNGSTRTIHVPANTVRTLSLALSNYFVRILAQYFLESFCQVTPPPPPPPPPEMFVNTAQTCSVDCGGVMFSFTFPTGYVFSTDQTAANSFALALACWLLQTYCGSITPPPTTIVVPGLVGNTPQIGSYLCNGVNRTITIPANVIWAATQEQANQYALSLAQYFLESRCHSISPPPPPPPPPPGLYFNTLQGYDANCPDGSSVFHAFVPAGTVVATSQAAANAIAHSWAITLAESQRLCLSGITPKVCVDTAYNSVITCSGGSAASWAIIIGALPPGLSFDNGRITGVPLTPGFYSFDVEVANSLGYFVRRHYTIRVVEITTAALPGGTVGTPYSATLSETGGELPVEWQLQSGSLPPGLTLNQSTGAISGTPTTSGTYTFTILLQDEAT